MTVYKYVTEERLDILENTTIRFTQPEALNDPFEFALSWVEYRKNLAERALRDTGLLEIAPCLFKNPDQILKLAEELAIRQVPDELGKSFALLSLTINRNNLLLWSHYSNSHKGFVIGFDSESPFFKPGSGKANQGLREVEYSDERWPMPESGRTKLTQEEMGEASIKCFFRKSTEWAYERELRILASPAAAAQTLRPDGVPPIYLYPFPPECLKEVILGYRMSKTAKQRITEVIKSKFPHAEIFQAKLDDRHFQLQIVPFTTQEFDFFDKLAGGYDPTAKP